MEELELTEQEQQNAVFILNIIKRNANYYIHKDKIYDVMEKLNHEVYYLCINKSHYPISENEYNLLKEYGVEYVER